MRIFSILTGWWLSLLLFSPQVAAQQEFQFQNEPMNRIIQTLEAETGYHFLYRESQIAHIQLSFNADSDNFPELLKEKLASNQLSVNIDTARKQIVIFKNRETSATEISISGQVVDASTGERLPFATVTWKTSQKMNGVAANASGVYMVLIESSETTLTVSGSYIGYTSNSVKLDLSQNNHFSDLTLRLEPETVSGSDIIITGFSFTGSSDTLYRNFVNAGVLNPLGENNTTRALQSLPSVATGTAMNNGISVRGSAPDATQILLDGITIYNQSHLFGLLDSFNPEALQTSGFFYDVTPAQFPSTPGGTISLLTKTGSLNDYNYSAGMSNTAVNMTADGPFIKGRSSWLLSGRTSFLNAVNWFQNDELISYGLNIDRPKDVLDDNLRDLESRLVQPGNFDASFFDLHGKFYVEYENGSRLIGSSYFGGDDVSQDAQRVVRRFNPSNPNQRFSTQEVNTHNEWGNFSFSLAYKTPVSPSIYSHSLAAISVYTSEFSKDDFVYNRVQPGNSNSLQVFTYPLKNQSVFNEIKIEQYFDYVPPFAQFTFGISTQYFMGEYFEESFDRPGFLTTFDASLTDLYAQMDYTDIPDVNIHLGSRLHYYSNGDFLHYSPRIKLKFFDNRKISVSTGYSRDFQFAHRLAFYNVSSPDVWVISSAEQPPTISDYFTAGFYVSVLPNTRLQFEGYYKVLENARMFDINAQTLTETFNAPPWLYDNDGEAKGIEMLIHHQWNKLQLTGSYSISEASFQNDAIRSGEQFYAEWDRTHSINTTLEYQVLPGLKAFGGYTYATGAPNRLHFLQIEDEERLGDYKRLDAGLEYRTSFEKAELEFNFSVFNLLNRKNPWYREMNLVIDTSVPQNQQRLSSVPVDVYDLGIQPSFSLSVWF